MKKQKGAGLIEVLVTLFIVSVGMLGIAGLQTVSMQAGQEASLRTSALFVVEDIAGRMQANRKGVTFYTVVKGNKWGCVTNVATVCEPKKLAEYDVALWKENIGNVLPAGATGTVTILGVLNGVAAVRVSVDWKVRDKKKNYTSEFRIYTK
jgi:type IV pilus assembly protein PilV